MLSYEQRALLLLGVLKTEATHGYLLHEFIEKNLSRVADIKKPTAYATLDKLLEEGNVAVHEERIGNRPPRKVYTITEQGNARFVELLRSVVKSNDDLRGGSDIGVMFIDALPHEEAKQYLEKRLEQRRAELFLYEQTAMQHAIQNLGLGVSLAFSHMVHLCRADVAFLTEALGKMIEIHDVKMEKIIS